MGEINTLGFTFRDNAHKSKTHQERTILLCRSNQGLSLIPLEPIESRSTFAVLPCIGLHAKLVSSTKLRHDKHIDPHAERAAGLHHRRQIFCTSCKKPSSRNSTWPPIHCTICHTSICHLLKLLRFAFYLRQRLLRYGPWVGWGLDTTTSDVHKATSPSPSTNHS